jgi:4-diphosphocytidyl-2-C-methyl-D-erythritol kinase
VYNKTTDHRLLITDYRSPITIMIAFPPCKINLGLHVVSKRPDGYHNIETCFYPVPWTDMLEIIPADRLAFTFSGSPISGKEEDNLCVRAYSLLKQDFDIPPVHLHLHKIIPSGAGLGGGSSDAAATLKLLNEILSLGIGIEKLRYYASQLGSDSPFFIEPKPALGCGKGEIITPLSVSLNGKFLVVVSPGIHCSTAEAYRDVKARQPKKPLKEILEQPLAEWSDTLRNDFEPSVFSTYPLLRDIKEKLYQLGAWYASMSGSGSSIFGLFDQPQDIGKDFQGMQLWCGKLTQ